MRIPKSMWLAATVAVGLLALWLVCIVVANRFHHPAPFEPAQVTPPDHAPPAPQTARNELTIATWNIGYAGMGKEADFVADGGTQKRPPSKQTVENHLQGITRQIQALGTSDVLFLQEVARPSWSTYGVDTLDPLLAAYPDASFTYGADLKTRFMPLPLRIEVGNAVFSRLPLASAERRGLPLEPEFYVLVFRRGYRMHIVRVSRGPGEPEWVLVNVHLSAFDKEGNVRRRQFEKVIEFAAGEYQKGNLVVVGGDWNCRLAPSSFKWDESKNQLGSVRSDFWAVDVSAMGPVPAGWAWATDASNPSVRTAHRPYVQDENIVLIVDGFLCSPNVEILETKTIGLGFEHSDHHPVVTKVRAKK